MSYVLNDADIEMIELAEAGTMTANGVCFICEDALYPIEFAAKNPGSYTNPRYTAEMAAECVGPVDEQLGVHVWCLEERE